MEFGDSKKLGFVQWTCEDAGIYFRELFREYFNEVFRDKPEGWPGHPYLFVKMDRSHFGEPLTIANLSNQFYAVCEKIGLDRRSSGVNPHGLRHFYGFYSTNILGMSLEILQHQMHHASPLSSKVYEHISQQTVREHLLKAQRVIGGQGEEGKELEPKLIASAIERSALVRDPFGLLDYFRKRTLK
jgi:hypothetical protein